MPQDKERLDFLEGQAGGKRWEVGNGWWTIHYETLADRQEGGKPRGMPTLRAAIDKAMKEEAEEDDVK